MGQVLQARHGLRQRHKMVRPEVELRQGEQRPDRLRQTAIA